MQTHKIVSREQWLAARKALMAREKELTREREALSEARRSLPWVKVDKHYLLDGPGGKVSLADLFKGRPQLVVQHVMFAPEWACHYLDLTPLGRHEDGLPYPMDWVRLRGQYERDAAKAGCCHE